MLKNNSTEDLCINESYDTDVSLGFFLERGPADGSAVKIAFDISTKNQGKCLLKL